MPNSMPDIPAKRYFTIGEVAELCGLKTHVLRYWEQEFPQLNPVKRRGNRRYYQRDDVLLIHTIRQLLYDEGFTINGARQKLEQEQKARQKPNKPPVSLEEAMSPANASTHTLDDEPTRLTAEDIGADFDLGHLRIPKQAPRVLNITRADIAELLDMLEEVRDALK